MKKIAKYTAIALSALAIVGCNDLDTQPMGSTVTSQQKEDVLAQDPEMLEAAVFALPQGMKLAGALYSSHHADYGVASMFMITDSRGMDMPAPNVGYNWYSAAAEMSDFGGNYYDNLLFWKTFYNLIQASNSLESVIDAETDKPELQYNLAQALTFRAYSYYNLAQMYQFTYAKNPDAPCVPIITTANMMEVVDGNPRATVAEVYKQVIDDLSKSIELLESAESKNVLREGKNYVNAMVAYGLRARAYMMMTDWANAAADAQKAIDLATAEGLSPLSSAEASVPGFYEINAHNIMWGIDNSASESFTQGVRNFASMMGSWMPNGYCSTGTYRCINKKLFNNIPLSDVRRNWWLDDLKVPSTLPAAYKSYIASLAEDEDAKFIPYTQVKFGAADNAPGEPNGATDIPLMRIEEMYLILAEAQGRTSAATGAQTLNKFVQTYRDPQFTAPTAADALIDEIWFQRRVELWGEGFSYYDMMRLQKPMNRLGGGFDEQWVYVVAPDDPVLLYVIITDEQQANPLLGDCDNGASIPSPVVDED